MDERTATQPPHFGLTREQEVLTRIMRTADALRRHFGELIEREDLSLPQFNVLRILRRAGPAGLPTLCIRDRMVERAPAITRLLDRLTARGWVTRHRDPEDRRVVHCRITDAGMEVLARLDPILDVAGPEVLTGVSPDGQSEILEALGTILANIEPEAGDL